MTKVLLFIFLTLTCIVKGEHIFAQLPDSYFPTEIPTYLSSPIQYTEPLPLCGLVGNSSTRFDSYCNSTTLLQIQTIIQCFAGNVTEKVNSTITTLRDAFVRVGDLLWRRFEADKTALDGYKTALEKIILDYRKLQVGIGREMVGCMNTVSRILGGFLCAGCNVTKNSKVIRPSLQPIIHLKSSVVEAIEKNCTRFMGLVSESVDIYHRTKMILTDLLTAELGAENHLCTCSGQVVNYTGIFNYNTTGVNRNLATNDYTISLSTWDPYVNDTSMVDSEITNEAAKYALPVENPYFVQNSSSISEEEEVEKYSNTTLNSSGIFQVKGQRLKAYKMQYLSDFTSLSFALGRIFNRTVQKRSFASLYRELNELIDLSGFSFGEIRDTALNLYDSFIAVVADSKKLGLIYKLFAKLVVDFLLKPPPSAYYIGFSVPNATAVILAKYGAALLRIVRDYRFDDHALGYACSLPYIDLEGESVNEMVSEFSCSPGTCNLPNLALCEKRIITNKPDTAIVVPLFRIMNRVKMNVTEFKGVVQTFVETYKDISLVDQEFRNYLMIKYFPPHYYVINSHERKLSSKNAMASAAEEYYNTIILRYLQEIYEDILNYVKVGPKNMELLRELLRAEKDVGRSDHLLRKYAFELEKPEYQKLLNYEKNKRAAIYLMKCMSESTCKVGYVGNEGKTVELNLPVKTTMNPDYALMEKRMLNGLLGMTSIHEFANYSDEENLALAKCNRLYSARTSLCVEPVEQELLRFPVLENPPDYSKLRGTELAAVMFTRYKVQSLIEFAAPLQPVVDEIGQGKGGNIPNDPIIVVDDKDGMDLLEDTGLNYTLNMSILYFDTEFPKVLPPTLAKQTSGAIKSLWSMWMLIAMVVFGILIQLLVQRLQLFDSQQ
eukprot:TRINITY_DN87962_c0_g1_i1.p1 TRINITY_DN87962_c0_g1~~TRINITY_DN87962_c0_g1_i1.p1  ORF type:complete len:890 (-),score=77.45 TRINITY_DN87962_c0_g1_i1:1417-4086(-)